VRIRSADVKTVSGTSYTHWVFLFLHTDAGLTGMGEACLGNQEALLGAALHAAAGKLVGQDAARAIPPALSPAHDYKGVLQATVKSAIDMALWDLRAQALGQPVYKLLGPTRQTAIPLYANINRGARDRSPGEMARRAKQAVKEGYIAVKIAPFDGVTRTTLHRPDGDRLLGIALDRIRAVREAVGPEASLFVDCHWRLDLPAALKVAGELDAIGVRWMEDVFPYEDLAAWRALRQASRVPLVAGELARNFQDLRLFLDEGLVDLVMPDIRYYDGITGLQALIALCDQYSVGYSIHNPRGPVGSVASAHVAAVAPNFRILEFAYGECEWRNELVGGAEDIRDGKLHLRDKPGLGIDWNDMLATANAFGSDTKSEPSPGRASVL
jgi:galactonate dehydratase